MNCSSVNTARRRRFPHGRAIAGLCRALVSMVVALATGSIVSLRAAELPAGFVEETLVTNIHAAAAMTVAPDGRVFFAGQTGALRVWKDGRLLPTPAMDLAERLDTWWERGLVGVSLHPDFPRPPHLFVVYVAKTPYPHHVVSRFTVTGDDVDPASERILLEGDDQRQFGGNQPAGHQGGPIRVGPDRKLYVALGEQTAGKPSQSLSALQGKILRIDPDGSIPADNPFFTRTTGKYRAIWALGLRNPFGLAFQPGTGRLFESDVGQSSWEEVNEIVRGGNYGWPHAEGRSTDPSFQNPLHTYPPVIGRCICGGAFYPQRETGVPPAPSTSPSEPAPRQTPAPSFPLKWHGRFFFVDWAAHWIKALDPEAPTNVVTFAHGLNAPVAIEIAPDGSLLVLNRGTIWRDGKKFLANSGSLVRIRYAGLTPAMARAAANTPPLPRALSATGLLDSLTPFRPRPGFVPFQINAPPWQPGIVGRRWISLPAPGRLHLNGEGEFEFPNGAVVVQHYALSASGAPFETHALWFTGPRQARAAAYRWSADAKDAELVEDSEIVPLPGSSKRHWFSPGVEQFLNLDGVVAGFLLPVSPRQLNRDEQLQRWNDRDWLAPKLRPQDLAALPRLTPLDDTTASLELRVRSYLDVNCSACHRPGGAARGNFDARFLTPLPEQRLVDGELAAGDLGILGARVLVPGNIAKSLIFQRVKHDDFFRMPPVSVNYEPQPVLPLLEAWIRSMNKTAAAH